jgi:hypothetical protein
MADAYLCPDGEVEAEHVWVNEWADGARAAVVETLAPAPSLGEAPAALADQDLSDQLLRDLAEIERVRDDLEREARTREVATSAGSLARLRHILALARSR